jgi:hypothetical protein
MPRSDITHISVCVVSGISDAKSQKGVVRRRGLRNGVVRLGLHGMNEVGELHRVLDEEDRDVVAHQIPVALVGVELDGETANVARGVGRAAFAGHGGEAHEHRRDLARRLKRGGAGEFGQRLVRLEDAVRGRTSRMHDALGNPLVIEVRDLLAQDEVLQQRRPAQSGLERVLVVADGHALVGGQHLATGVGARVVERASAGRFPLDRRAAGLVRRVDFTERAGGCRLGQGLDRLPGRRSDGVVAPEFLALDGVVRHRRGKRLNGSGLVRDCVVAADVSCRDRPLLRGHGPRFGPFHGAVLSDGCGRPARSAE